MGSRFLNILLIVALVFSPLHHAFAQGAGSSAASSDGKGGGPRKHLATIIFAGLGGAILGLSTLSFYGRPQEKLNNIAIGFAFGVIAGTALVTYKAATQPDEFYAFRTPEGEVNSRLTRADVQTPTPLSLSQTFTF